MTPDQTTFHDALLDPAAAIPGGLSDSEGRPAGRRYNVYRNNVAVSLTEALHTAFPTIVRLIGAENMDGLAGLYLRAHPPRTPLMMQYGTALPEFITTLPQLEHLAYLPDIARLDLAMRQSYHAADAPPVKPAELDLTPEALLRSVATLAPSLRLLRSPWPIHAIWAFANDPNAPKPTGGAQEILITRPIYDPAVHLLPPGGADFLTALARGTPLGAAHAAVPDLADPGPIIALLLQGQALVSLTIQEPAQ